MKNKDEFSMTKLGLTSSNSQQNIFTLDYTRNNNRNNFNHTTINKKENVFRSLPKLKYGYLNNEKKITQIIKIIQIIKIVKIIIIVMHQH